LQGFFAGQVSRFWMCSCVTLAILCLPVQLRELTNLKFWFQVMKASKGKASPVLLNKILGEKLKGNWTFFWYQMMYIWICHRGKEKGNCWGVSRISSGRS
jgi:hypothetical protein